VRRSWRFTRWVGGGGNSRGGENRGGKEEDINISTIKKGQFKLSLFWLILVWLFYVYNGHFVIYNLMLPTNWQLANLQHHLFYKR
jgi:hypothetical protein